MPNALNDSGLEAARELAGRTALVTGGTSGIGRATALALARRGAVVAISGRDRHRGDKVVQEIAAEVERDCSSPRTCRTRSLCLPSRMRRRNDWAQSTS